MISFAFLALSAVGAGACVSSAAYTSRVQQANPISTGQMLTVNGHGVNVLTAGTDGPPVLMIHGASANAREFSWTLAPRLLDRPDLVEGLVLSAPVSHDWGGGGQAWYNGLSASPVIGPVFTQLVPTVGPAQVKAGINGVFDPAPVPENYFENSAIGLLFRPPNFRANAKDVRALEAELAAQSTRYPELKMPIVVFSGSKDTVIKPKLHVGELKKQVPVELVILPDEGHMPHHAHGDDVANAIRRLAMNGKSR